MGTSEINIVNTPDVVFANWLARFRAVVEQRDADAMGQLFSSDGYWRDILSFTWEHRTFSGPGQIRDAFAQSCRRFKAGNVRIAGERTAPRLVGRMGRTVIEAYFEFTTEVGHSVGFVRLLHNEADPLNPKVWLLLTTLHEIRGFEEKVGKNRPRGDEYSRIVSPVSWKQARDKERSYEDRDPQVVIVGAGQGGLILAARLRQMGVDALVVDKCERVGDVWRNRYNNLTLHNELVANHFPYLPFPATWPFWLPKDMLASWLESYAELLELNVWTSTEVGQARFDEATKEWRLSLRRGDGSVRDMRCKHVVMATGASGGTPIRPQLPGLPGFSGTVLHSGEFKSGTDWTGKHAIVIGTGNSGHDVAQDLYVSGAASVSIMQRGPTCVVSLDPSARISYAVYGQGVPVEDVDLMVASIPHPVLLETYKWVTKRTNEYDKELLAKLHAVGFRTHDGEDGTGFQLLYLRGAGGYYIDVGGCQLIIDQKVKLIHAKNMDRFESKGLRMKDGTVVPADLVVTATGFEGMEAAVRAVLGGEIADKIGPVWGFDEDNVLRNMWRRTAQEGLWLMGGAIIEARLYSRYLALEIRASLEGLLPDRSAMPLVRRPPAK